MKILIIEDDKEIAGLLSVYLTKNGYTAASCYDGVAGLNELREHTAEYGMILLDMMLPGFSGDELLPRFRAITDAPVIVISAVSALDQRMHMLRSGADDYIIKPFELPDVLVRIEAVARRSGVQLRPDAPAEASAAFSVNGREKAPEKERELTYGRLRLNPDSAEVYIGEQPISLTAREYDILLLFMKNPAKLFSRANLYESVWNEEYFPEDRSLKVHLSNLRSKLRKYDDFDYIETVWGMGYRMRRL